MQTAKSNRKREEALATEDSKQAQTSVTNAIAVLEAFYKESGEIAKESWEFMQRQLAKESIHMGL